MHLSRRTVFRLSAASLAGIRPLAATAQVRVLGGYNPQITSVVDTGGAVTSFEARVKARYYTSAESVLRATGLALRVEANFSGLASRPLLCEFAGVAGDFHVFVNGAFIFVSIAEYMVEKNQTVAVKLVRNGRLTLD